MKNAWFFGTDMWAEYLAEYAKTRPECLREWKSSPLALDHDFSEYVDEPASAWDRTEHQTQVLDLRTHKWSDVRKSYRGLINQARAIMVQQESGITLYRSVHVKAFGKVRNGETFFIQEEWIRSGNAMCTVAIDTDTYDPVAAAFWIVYQGCAYYASGPSVKNNVQHRLIWASLQFLRDQGVTLVELGQIDGETEKEKGISRFKSGFGGTAMPFTVVRRING